MSTTSSSSGTPPQNSPATHYDRRADAGEEGHELADVLADVEATMRRALPIPHLALRIGDPMTLLDLIDAAEDAVVDLDAAARIRPHGARPCGGACAVCRGEVDARGEPDRLVADPHGFINGEVDLQNLRAEFQTERACRDGICTNCADAPQERRPCRAAIV